MDQTDRATHSFLGNLLLDSHFVRKYLPERVQECIAWGICCVF
jgi:hypothetical protein